MHPVLLSYIARQRKLEVTSGFIVYTFAWSTSTHLAKDLMFVGTILYSHWCKTHSNLRLDHLGHLAWVSRAITTMCSFYTFVNFKSTYLLQDFHRLYFDMKSLHSYNQSNIGMSEQGFLFTYLAPISTLLIWIAIFHNSEAYEKDLRNHKQLVRSYPPWEAFSGDLPILTPIGFIELISQA